MRFFIQNSQDFRVVPSRIAHLPDLSGIMALLPVEMKRLDRIKWFTDYFGHWSKF
jgi:hypothetical protein